MTAAANLVNQLQDIGVSIRLDGTEIVLSPASLIPSDLLVMLKQRKPELIAYLARPPVNVVRERCEVCGSRLKRADECVRCAEGGAEMPEACQSCGDTEMVCDPQFKADGSISWWRCDVCAPYRAE